MNCPAQMNLQMNRDLSIYEDHLLCVSQTLYGLYTYWHLILSNLVTLLIHMILVI